jgi:hypothetical protein
MFDQDGTPISAPIGWICPSSGMYEIHCGIDWDAASGWGKPTDSLGCIAVGGYSGVVYCCPCP